MTIITLPNKYVVFCLIYGFEDIRSPWSVINHLTPFPIKSNVRILDFSNIEYVKKCDDILVFLFCYYFLYFLQLVEILENSILLICSLCDIKKSN